MYPLIEDPELGRAESEHNSKCSGVVDNDDGGSDEDRNDFNSWTSGRPADDLAAAKLLLVEEAAAWGPF